MIEAKCFDQKRSCSRRKGSISELDVDFLQQRAARLQGSDVRSHLRRELSDSRPRATCGMTLPWMRPKRALRRQWLWPKGIQRGVRQLPRIERADSGPCRLHACLRPTFTSIALSASWQKYGHRGCPQSPVRGSRQTAISSIEKRLQLCSRGDGISRRRGDRTHAEPGSQRLNTSAGACAIMRSREADAPLVGRHVCAPGATRLLWAIW